jgi:hypothetical protein
MKKRPLFSDRGLFYGACFVGRKDYFGITLLKNAQISSVALML